MLRQFSCTNFRNIQVENMELGRINLLIGPNNAGKSNLIRALSFCGNMISAGTSETTGFLSEVQRNGFSEMLKKGGKNSEIRMGWQIALKDQNVNYTLSFDTGKDQKDFRVTNESLDSVESLPECDHPFNFFRCHQEQAGTGRFSTALKMGQKNKRATAEVSQYETVLLQFDKLVIQNQELLEQPYIRETIFTMLEELRAYLRRFYSYSSSGFDFSAIRQLCSPQSDGAVLKKDGSNLVNLYERLCTEDKAFAKRFKQKMKSLIPDLTDIRVVKGLDKIGMQLVRQQGKFLLSEVSDGTIEALLLALLFSMPPGDSPSLLAIDEPEVNLHPAWQKLFARWVQTSGNIAQCFISTHSPDFLDEFTEGFLEGKVNLYVYDPIGKNSFRALDRERMEEALEGGWFLGDLYRVNDPAIGGWPW